QRLEDIGSIFKNSLSKPPSDGQAHLRRILADAQAGISKYQLLLSERAAHAGGVACTHSPEVKVDVQDSGYASTRRSPVPSIMLSPLPVTLPLPYTNRERETSMAFSASQYTELATDTDESQGFDTQLIQPARKRRTRTLTTPHQAAVLHSVFAKVCIVCLLAG
ncbi:hypothetical protein ID866_10111, partial [Astraeus odoratus]